MSEHLVPITEANVIEGIDGLAAAVGRVLRAPLRVEYRGTDVAYVFTPDLTAQEVTRFAELVATARSRIRFTVEEYDGLRDDIAGLRTYNGLATPTLAQTAAATKAQNRILRAMLRD